MSALVLSFRGVSAERKPETATKNSMGADLRLLSICGNGKMLVSKNALVFSSMRLKRRGIECVHFLMNLKKRRSERKGKRSILICIVHRNVNERFERDLIQNNNKTIK